MTVIWYSRTIQFPPQSSRFCTFSRPRIHLLQTMLPFAAFITNKIIKRGSPANPKPPTASNNIPSSSSTTSDLCSFICASPLLSTCGLNKEDISNNIQLWTSFGEHVADNLGFKDSLTDIQRRRIYQYYLPVYFWLRSQLAQHRSTSPTPLCIGISAPQGCGKSTLCEQLVALFAFEGKTAASVSIDDFYLTNAEQRALADTHPGNRLLELRGNAGSHDLAIGTKVLAALKKCNNNNKDKNNRTSSPSSSGGVKLPRYDKSAFSGRGDRASSDTWPQVHPPLEIILLEGWMLGFKAVPDQQAQQIDPNLTPVNTYLHEYTNAWDSYVDCWLVVKVSSPEFAFRWRLQAEQAQRAAGKSAMTDEQVEDFVSRYMPAYRAYLPGLYEKGPTTGVEGKVLVVEVNEERDPASIQPKPIM